MHGEVDQRALGHQPRIRGAERADADLAGRLEGGAERGKQAAVVVGHVHDLDPVDLAVARDGHGPLHGPPVLGAGLGEMQR